MDIKSPHKIPTPHIQSNLCITTTRGTKFLWLLWPSGHYREGLCIRAKTVNSDICSLYKGSIIFHLITHDTDKNKSVYIFVRNKELCCNKTTYYKKLISWELILTSRASTLCSGCYIQVIKSLGYHLSGCWSCCTCGRYIERSLT